MPSSQADGGAQEDADMVEGVYPMHNTKKLDPLVKEYQKLQQNLEDLVDDIKFRKLHGKKIKPKQVRHQIPRCSQLEAGMRWS